MIPIAPVRTIRDFEVMYANLASELLAQEPFDRGSVHAQQITDPQMHTMELRHVNLQIQVSSGTTNWQNVVKPNLPWAEDHFGERCCGEPLNPPPSEQWWPYAQQGNAVHKADQEFSHTYPERFWPRFANVGGTMRYSERVAAVPHVGIRFEYGDLEDLVNLLKKDPLSRQAYLPIWFPEDLNAANHGERVPCTLGYHFMVTPEKTLDCFYPMRSCDAVRFFRDDVYMAGRLVQHIGSLLDVRPGLLVMQISNLHAFQGDRHFLNETVRQYKPQQNIDARANYKWEALG